MRVIAADVAKYNLAHHSTTDKDLWMYIPAYSLIEDPFFNYWCSLKDSALLIFVYLLQVLLISVC